MAAVSVSDFVQHKHAQCLPNGIESYVDIALLLLQLNTIAKTMAKGTVESNFYRTETSFYDPLQETLEANLPIKGLVYTGNSLYQNSNPKHRTDISIAEISQANNSRFDKDLRLTHFIEMKTLLCNDRIDKGAIEHDLEKLVECEKKYSAIGFFVLTALQTELSKHDECLAMLQLGKRDKPFIVKTTSGKEIHLRPAGNVRSSNPHVYVFEVSGTKATKDAQRSGLSYSIFQGSRR